MNDKYRKFNKQLVIRRVKLQQLWLMKKKIRR
jgi:hypothetical protein